MEILKYSVNDNSKCPCGSGKRFVQCCKWKKHEYSNIGKDYKGRNVIIDDTEQEKLMFKLSQEYFKLKYSKVTEENALELLEYIYKYLDAQIKSIKKYIPCSKGCSKCCYMYIDCSPIEAKLIKRYIDTYFNEEQIKDLRIKIKNNLKYVPTYKEILQCKTDKQTEDIVYKYRDMKIPCLFLNEYGECTIYKVRPLQCRNHFIISDPEICRNDNIATKVRLKSTGTFVSTIGSLSTSVVEFQKYILNDKAKMNDIEYVSNFVVNMKPFSVLQSLFYWFKDI